MHQVLQCVKIMTQAVQLAKWRKYPNSLCTVAFSGLQSLGNFRRTSFAQPFALANELAVEGTATCMPSTRRRKHTGRT